MKDRSNAFTIEVTSWGTAEMWNQLVTWQEDKTCESTRDIFGVQPDYNKESVFWFEPTNVPVELFKYQEYFNWFKGSGNIWIGDLHLTKNNYRTAVYIGEGEEMVVEGYEYLDQSLMTNTAPIQEEDNSDIN